MKSKLYLLFFSVIICIMLVLSACTIAKTSGENSGSGAEAFENENTVQNESSKVTEVNVGTSFDYNNDGTNDIVVALVLENQFDFIIIDGTNADYLVNERIMIPFCSSKLSSEIYTDENNRYAIKFTDNSVSEEKNNATKTLQYILNSKSYILEASDYNDNDNDNYIHTYSKYSYDEYIHKQNEYLKGYSYSFNINWENYYDNKIL